MKTFLISIFVFLSAFGLWVKPIQAQGIDLNDMMFSEHWFSSLEEAAKTPEKVLYLDLSLRKLRTFPVEILSFPNLQRLYLPYNYYPSIPDGIKNLKKLEFLDISGNYYLNQLPTGLGEMNQLKELIVKDHKLKAGELDRIRQALPNCKITDR